MRRGIAVILFFLALVVYSEVGFCGDRDMATLGGFRESGDNNIEIEDVARLTIDEHNNKENAVLEFVRVVKAKEEVVAGTLRHLTLEVNDAGSNKMYEAKMWVKPWLNCNQLQEFIHIPHFTSSDLGARQGEPEGGWKEVPSHDPEVEIAADHAIKAIQQCSNSLAPCVLQEILQAKAEVTEGLAKFDMLLNVKRGNNVEKYIVLVHKNNERSFHLNHLQLRQD